MSLWERLLAAIVALKRTFFVSESHSHKQSQLKLMALTYNLLILKNVDFIFCAFCAFLRLYHYLISGISAHFITQEWLSGSSSKHTMPPFWNFITGLAIDPVIKKETNFSIKGK